MPPVRTQKKTTISPQGMDLALFGFRKVAKAEALAAAANVTPVRHLLTRPAVSSPSQNTNSAQAASSKAAQQSSSTVNVKPKPRLPKPVVLGVRHAHFVDSRCDWDGKYHRVVGTSTRKISFGSSFKLTDKHIDDIVFMGPRVYSVLKEFVFQYEDVDYDAHNDAHGLTDQGVKTLTQHCPNLKKLLLPGTSGLGNESLYYSFYLCPALTHLEITGSCNFNGDLFFELERHPHWAPSLKKLRLGEQSDKAFMKGMRDFSRARPQLPIELVTTSQEKQYGPWNLVVSHYVQEEEEGEVEVGWGLEEIV